jgi:hypothetical protein
MRGFIAVLYREVAQRRLVFLAAPVAALVPFAIPLLRGLKGMEAMEARSATALILSGAFLFGLSSLIGGTVLPRGIAARSIGFDLARPISTFTIWSGTLASAILLGLVCAAIVWLPSAVTGDPAFWQDLVELARVPLPWPIAAALAATSLFGLFCAAGIALRSRSWLILLDLLLLPAILAGLGIALMRIGPDAAFGLSDRIVMAFSTVALAALLAAGYAGFSSGRTDIRAAHRKQSIVLWGTTVVGLVCLQAWVSWLHAARPRDLTSMWANPTARGNWITIDGAARGLRAKFLYDAQTGRHRRLAWSEFEVAISGDGSRAVWPELRRASTVLWSWKLDDPESRPKRTALSFPKAPRNLILDDAGTRVAAFSERQLGVYDLEQGRLLASAPLSEGWRTRGFFVGDRLRILDFAKTEDRTFRLDISELDVSAGRLTKSGAAEDVQEWSFVIADRTGDRLLIFEPHFRRVQLVDGRSGRRLAVLAEAPTRSWGRFLSDGRILLAERIGDRRRLHLFGEDGSPARVIELPGGEQVSLGGEAAPGRIIVGVGALGDQKILLVDLDSGEVRSVADHLSPVVRSLSFFGPANATVMQGSEATKLFLRGSGALVRLDPLSGERRQVLPPPKD